MLGSEIRDAAVRSPVPGADPNAVISLINTIELLPDSATGALIFGPLDNPIGLILIENGRVCWARADVMIGRLGELLRARLDPGANSNELASLVQRCRAEGRSIGDALVSGGLVSSDGFRDALLQHTAEAVLALAGREGEPPAWVARAKPFGARFSFSSVELLVSAGAAWAPGQADEARSEMERMLRLGGFGVAFAQVSGSSGLVPIGEAQGSKLTLSEAIELGAWGARAVRQDRVVRGGVPRLVAAMGPNGDALVAWLTGAVIYVVICPSPSSLAHVLGKRARAPSDDRSGS
ncbi:MAG: hypothetical protein HUU21_39365 [Polyangiaceae bacterium]|nr:hypothetical protein [Polyangiaceae bacterium]NUQ79604.1 hypothetical protein [Polyangiaceae bacterium]